MRQRGTYKFRHIIMIESMCATLDSIQVWRWRWRWGEVVWHSIKFMRESLYLLGSHFLENIRLSYINDHIKNAYAIWLCCSILRQTIRQCMTLEPRVHFTIKLYNEALSTYIACVLLLSAVLHSNFFSFKLYEKLRFFWIFFLSLLQLIKK